MLDCAQSDFIAYDKMVISLKGGEMWVVITIIPIYAKQSLMEDCVSTLALFLPCSYVLTLITDGMRSVRAFHFDKAAASVLTTCVSNAFTCEQWLFDVYAYVYFCVFADKPTTGGIMFRQTGGLKANASTLRLKNAEGNYLKKLRSIFGWPFRI